MKLTLSLNKYVSWFVGKLKGTKVKKMVENITNQRLLQAPNREDVISLYTNLLGRLPENEEVINNHLRSKTIRDLIKGFASTEEFLNIIGEISQNPHSPFFHFNTSLDVRAIINSHVNHYRLPEPGRYVNFLGVSMPTDLMPHLADLGGQLDPIPIPANFHADMAEWAAALRAVDLASENFTMIELGCGWGCWMNNTGVAAKARGLNTHVIGVEGDDKHLEFAHEILAHNGISLNEYTLKRGIAAPRSGYALFPHRQGKDRWGAEPIFDVSKAEMKEAVATGKFDRLPQISLMDIMGDYEKIDLVHMDIQGGGSNLGRAIYRTFIREGRILGNRRSFPLY